MLVGLVLLFLVMLLAAVPLLPLLQALGLYGNKPSVQVPPKSGTGPTFLQWVGGIAFVVVLALIFPPLAWAVIGLALAYWVFVQNAISKISANFSAFSQASKTAAGATSGSTGTSSAASAAQQTVQQAVNATQPSMTITIPGQTN